MVGNDKVQENNYLEIEIRNKGRMGEESGVSLGLVRYWV